MPIVSLAILAGQAGIAAGTGTQLPEKLAKFAEFYTGFNIGDGTFNAQSLLIGYGPWVAKRFLMPFIRGSIRMPRGIPVSIS